MYFSNKNLTESVYEVLENKVDNDNNFIITSTEKLSQKYNYELLTSTNRAFNKTNIFSFNNFIIEIYEQTYNTKVIDELQFNNLIINSLISSDNKNNYNYINQIGSQINGLRRDGINSQKLFDNLQNKVNSSEFDTDRLLNLAKILSNYENLLVKKNLIDFHIALKTLTLEIETNDILKGKLFIFDRFNLFSIPELEFIDSLSQKNRIRINTKWESLELEKNEVIFSSDLKDIGLVLYDNNNIELKISAERRLLDYKDYLNNLNSDKLNVETFKYSNIREEVYGVTKLVKYLLNIKKFKPSDICIVSRQSNDYSQLFKEFFADNNIPTNINDRLELSKSPVIISIINVLESIISNFSFNSLEGLFSSPYIDLGIENKSSILTLAKKFRIIGGIPDKGFKQFLDILSTRLKLYEKANSAEDSDGISSEVKSLQDLQSKLIRVNSLFEEIDTTKSYSNKEFVELLYTIISKFKVKKSILLLDKFIEDTELDFTSRVFYTEKIESDSRALYKFTELLNKIDLLDNSNTKYDLSELVKNLKGLLSITKFQIREKKQFGVDITSIEQIRGLDYKVKILVGAVEGKLPLPFGTDKLLGLVLPDSEERHYFNEFMQFYDFINDDSKKYIFNYHLDESKLAIESHFITQFLVNKSRNLLDINSELSDINPTMEWQQSIINIRDTIDTAITKNKENDYRISEFKKSKDLNVKQEFNQETIDEVLEKRTFSVSELNSIEFNKYNHFYERILRLKKSDELNVYFSNLELGNLIHKVTENTLLQYKHTKSTVTAINSIGIKHFDESFKVHPNHKNELLKLFKNNLVDGLGRFKNKHKYYELEKLYLLGDSNSNGLLVLWFEKLVTDLLSSPNYSILAMEYKFNNISIESMNKKIKFNGKIDRIDISDDRKYFKIVDYKTTESSESNTTQLVIYSEVAKKLLNESGINAEPVELQYFCFNYEKNYKVDISLNDKALNKIYTKIESIIQLDYSEFKANKYFFTKETKLLKRE